MKLFLAAALAGALGVSAASAASFTLSAGEAFVLPGGHDPVSGAPDPGAGSAVWRNASLGLDGPGRVTFSYVGSEAGYDNRFLVDGIERFGNKTGGADVTLELGAGPLPFAFGTVSPAGLFANGASQGYHGSIALLQKSATLVYALFNDSATSDQDYDDMVVRMELAPVPLPAAGWLLVAGIAGLGGLARRRSAAA